MRPALILALIFAVSADASAPSPQFIPTADLSAPDRKALGERLQKTFFSFTDCKSLVAYTVNEKPIETAALSRFDLICVTSDLKCELLTRDKSGDMVNSIEFTEISSENGSVMLRGDNGAMTVRFGQSSRATAMNMTRPEILDH